MVGNADKWVQKKRDSDAQLTLTRAIDDDNRMHTLDGKASKNSKDEMHFVSKSRQSGKGHRSSIAIDVVTGGLKEIQI